MALSFPIPSASHLPSNSKQPPPSPDLPGCLTLLCSRKIRDNEVRLLWFLAHHLKTSRGATRLPVPHPHDLGFGSQALKSPVMAYINTPGGVTSSPVSTSLDSARLPQHLPCF